MIKRIDHVSIAVEHRRDAVAFFEALGSRVVWSEPDERQGFHWTLLDIGESCLLEIIDPIGGESFLRPFLDSRGGGAHHITFHVDDLAAVNRRLDEIGVPTFGLGEPYPGWKELFIHPRHAFGVLLQFAEFEPLDWVKPGDPIPAAYRSFAEGKAEGEAETIIQILAHRLGRVSPGLQDQIRKTTDPESRSAWYHEAILATTPEEARRLVDKIRGTID